MKKVKKRKSVIALLFACLLLIPLYISPIFHIFSLKTGTTNTVSILENFGIFGEFSNAELSFALIGKEFASWMLLANNILLVITMVLGFFLIIDLILRMFNVKIFKIFDILFKINAVLLFLASLLMIVFGLLSMLCNSYITSEKLGSFVKIALETGFYLQLPAVLSGFLALFTFGQKGKTRKK